MVFAEFLNPGCYSQLYMIESKMKALKCGFFEGIYWSVLVSFMLTIVAFRMILGNKKIDIEPEIIKVNPFMIKSVFCGFFSSNNDLFIKCNDVEHK